MSILFNRKMGFSFLIAVTGLLFLFIESTYYQYVDAQGQLHESWFMPLGFLFIFIGLLAMGIFIIVGTFKAIRQSLA
ncbi:DUF3955 domain-containing protein [Shewanella gaetbuli]|uniref:DUF3955 domain-containing protein n=1 Tax=Shewanella gaetbuli TaxID=220752 RepID=A0A9X1ZNE9_9GAMM|nr:DUF3955 domain-containing protein [Shewanella gaetbuli]MCL1142690.1 DUF3955 domain-containing protein [Shewanella gaetbuli]